MWSSASLFFLHNGTADNTYVRIDIPEGFSTPSAYASSPLDVADMDGDGDKDILVASSLSPELYWFENVGGRGTTWEKHSITQELPGPTYVKSVDIDNDGDVDILAVGSGSVNYRRTSIAAWFLNTGNGTAFEQRPIEKFSAISQAYPLNLYNTYFADVNGDSTLDLLAAGVMETGRFPTKFLGWWEFSNANKTEATFTSITNDLPSISGPVEFTAADFDGDAAIDVCVTTASGLRVYTNGGNGTAWEEGPRLASNGYYLAALDVDRDGDMDLLASFFGSMFDHSVRWFENTGNATAPWAEQELYRQRNPNDAVLYNMLPLDVDKDYSVDLLFLLRQHNTEHIAWFKNPFTTGTIEIPHLLQFLVD